MNDDKISIVTYNIALKKNGLNASLTGIDKIRNILVNHTKEPSPIMTQFPNMLLLAEPKSQITILVQNEVIIVSDSSTEISQSKATILAAIISDLDEQVKDPLGNYAINLAYIFTYDSPSSVEQFAQYFNQKKLVGSGLVGSPDNISFGSFSINDTNKSGFTRVVVAARLNKDNEITNVVDFQRSLQFNAKTLPAISDLASVLLSEDKISRGLKDRLTKNEASSDTTPTPPSSENIDVPGVKPADTSANDSAGRDDANSSSPTRI
jgi:hypothetical protein